MASNSLGNIFRITSFGESHGAGIGVVIDGLPSGIAIDSEFIQKRLDERKPGSSAYVSPRKEDDRFQILSGVFNQESTGSPITIWIPNTNQAPQDYKHLKDVYRPSHADFTYQQKYKNRDYRGGGRASARVTAGWVAAGAIAEIFLKNSGIEVLSYVKQIYTHQIPDGLSIEQLRQTDNPIRCPHPPTTEKMQQAITQALNEKDSLGGIVATQILNCPIGLGEPVFEKFQANIGKAIFSLNAVKGLQFGVGFEMSSRKGSEVNDEWLAESNQYKTKTNHSGGLQGGISNGMPILFEVAFKPTATIGKPQQTIDIEGNPVIIEASGRHDPCVVPRAVPIVQALTWLVLADLWLMAKHE
ncbi:MAG: chorismate synthase [Bacteroidia bacterium]|nr:chorismate synthase [Bacteroidia bacterium]MCO5253904.1 chorismate synthase [Bacteroidota bacterium]